MTAAPATMIGTVAMIDTIHESVSHVPVAAPKVAGYVTGTPDIQWTDADWARFPGSGRLRIDQSENLLQFAAGRAHVGDIESGAGTARAFAAAVKVRVASGITWSTVYGGHGALQDVVAALKAAGPPGWYYGHVDCWLADWRLSQTAAAALIGTELYGLTCRAVQWASPSSNPGTPLPGSTLTLKQANCDLSVTAAWWHAYKPPSPPINGMVVVPVSATQLTWHRVTSSDGGQTWRPS